MFTSTSPYSPTSRASVRISSRTSARTDRCYEFPTNSDRLCGQIELPQCASDHRETILNVVLLQHSPELRFTIHVWLRFDNLPFEPKKSCWKRKLKEHLSNSKKSLTKVSCRPRHHVHLLAVVLWLLFQVTFDAFVHPADTRSSSLHRLALSHLRRCFSSQCDIVNKHESDHKTRNDVGGIFVCYLLLKRNKFSRA